MTDMCKNSVGAQLTELVTVPKNCRLSPFDFHLELKVSKIFFLSKKTLNYVSEILCIRSRCLKIVNTHDILT